MGSGGGKELKKKDDNSGGPAPEDDGPAGDGKGANKNNGNGPKPKPKPIPVKPAPQPVDTIDEESEGHEEPEEPARGNGYLAKQRPPRDDSDLPRPKYSVYRSHTDKSASTAERNRLLKILDDEAIKIIENPPGPVLNSQSYISGYEYYKGRCSARTEEELKQWFRQEKQILQQDTVELMLKAKLDASKDVETTRHNITSEFKLRLSSLANTYLEVKATFDEETMQNEQDKNEDILFFGTMLDRVKNKTIARPDVLTQMDNYSAECRQKMASTRGSAASWKSGNSSLYPGERRSNGFPREYRTPIPRSQLEAEATNVLAIGKENARKAGDVRNMERNALRNELDSRAASVAPVTQL